MAYNENFLFFNEGTDAANATGDGAMYNTVAITMGSSDVKLLMQELTAVLSNPRGGIFFQTDFVGEATNFLSGTNTLVITTAA